MSDDLTEASADKKFDEGWKFPDRLPCFNPNGTIFEETFNDQVALIAYAQYRRRHIICKETNEWLPFFAKTFADEVHKIRKNKRLTIKDAVRIWMQYWQPEPFFTSRDNTEKNWTAMLEPIMPYINGDWTLKLISEDSEYGRPVLITEKGDRTP